MLSINLNTTLK